MPLVRWDPSREMSSIQNEMNRLFDAFFDPAGGGQRTATPRWMPAMDLVERDDVYVLRADLPGLSEEDVAIEVDGDTLSISGAREAQHEDSGHGRHRYERAYGAFRRALTLPEGVDAEKITAAFDRGVLEITVPKPEVKAPRRVAISVGGAEPKTLEGAETSAEAGTETRAEAEPATA